MTCVDFLSDTTYRRQAAEQLNRLLDDIGKCPVKRSQIYGLRQIARQQPNSVDKFASHQCERAKRKQEGAAEGAAVGLQAEIDFWTLVISLSGDFSHAGDSSHDWSVCKEGLDHLPGDLQNIPPRQGNMTHEERTHRNKLCERRQKWLNQWNNEHIPAFFERFCTHYLYRRGMAENS